MTGVGDCPGDLWGQEMLNSRIWVVAHRVYLSKNLVSWTLQVCKLTEFKLCLSGETIILKTYKRIKPVSPKRTQP